MAIRGGGHRHLVTPIRGSGRVVHHAQHVVEWREPLHTRTISKVISGLCRLLHVVASGSGEYFSPKNDGFLSIAHKNSLYCSPENYRVSTIRQVESPPTANGLQAIPRNQIECLSIKIELL